MMLQQLINLEGLGNEINSTTEKRLHFFFMAQRAADKNYGDTAGGLLDLQSLTYLKTAYTRHIDIEEDQLDWLRRCTLQRQLAIISKEHLKTFVR